MAWNPATNGERRTVMNPKELRFTQLDIKLLFRNPEHPNVEEAIYRIRRDLLDPAEFAGVLTVQRDKDEAGVVWCKNNRRLYVLRMAGVPSVRVKFVSNDGLISKRIEKAKIKNKLNDSAFLPRIRGQTSGAKFTLEASSGLTVDRKKEGTSPVGSMVALSDSDGEGDSEGDSDPAFLTRIRGLASGFQIPLQTTSGPGVDQEQKGSSLMGFMSAVSAVAVAGYWGWKLFNSQQDNKAHADDDGDKNKK